MAAPLDAICPACFDSYHIAYDGSYTDYIGANVSLCDMINSLVDKYNARFMLGSKLTNKRDLIKAIHTCTRENPPAFKYITIICYTDGDYLWWICASDHSEVKYEPAIEYIWNANARPGDASARADTRAGTWTCDYANMIIDFDLCVSCTEALCEVNALDTRIEQLADNTSYNRTFRLARDEFDTFVRSWRTFKTQIGYK